MAQAARGNGVAEAPIQKQEEFGEDRCGTFAILAADKYVTVCEVVFAEKTGQILLGARTLEGFGVKVDNANGRFKPVEQLVTGLELIHEGAEKTERGSLWKK